MPLNKNIYPPDWKQFSLSMRYGRAKNICEWCGAVNGKYHPVTGSKVVLTVAHLDSNNGVCECFATTGMKCMNENHVKVLCQKCHLDYDRPFNRAKFFLKKNKTFFTPAIVTRS